ncbi:hypothetical protein QBC36DRAFT_182290 [Triangularia setosa]|uniref:Uncharacterized protein n=1 Tax=Triangularia setosa TaxID=2587417 RepID=A0AAN6WB33_9PEZI|nr:hypothetical protein QBC36DRAFT_182290 [Podospora setosa]
MPLWLLLLIIVWASLAFLITISIVCSPQRLEDDESYQTGKPMVPFLDNKIDCLKACRKECCCFPLYFLVYYMLVLATPGLLVLGLTLLVLWGLLLLLPFKILKKAGVKTYCGVEWHCLNQAKLGGQRRRQGDLEGGNSHGEGSRTGIRGERAAVGKRVVNSAPRPHVPMVATPTPVRTNPQRNSRSMPTTPPPAGPQRNSTAREGGPTRQQQPRSNLPGAQRSSPRSYTLSAENLSILKHRMTAIESLQARAGESTAAARPENRTPPPQYQELDPRNGAQRQDRDGC